MRNKLTTIRPKPDVSIIDFDKLDKIIKPVARPERMETNSLNELRNWGHLFSSLLTKTGNYQLLSAEKIPDERKPSSIIEKLPILKKRKLPGQRNKERKKKTLKKGKSFQSPPKKSCSKRSFLKSRSKSK